MIIDWIFDNVFLFIMGFFAFFFFIAYLMYYIFVKRNPALQNLRVGKTLERIVQPPPKYDGQRGKTYYPEQRNRTRTPPPSSQSQTQYGQRPEPVKHNNFGPLIDLKKHFTIQLPGFINSGNKERGFITLKNDTGSEIEDLDIDLSDMMDYFDVEGEVNDIMLKPGSVIKKSITIKPKYEEGVFPFKIVIRVGSNVAEQEFTIKVGGTEIY